MKSDRLDTRFRDDTVQRNLQKKLLRLLNEIFEVSK